MSLNSHIEWTDATWNPVRGCAKISPGCKHCYAETFAERFRGVKGHPYEQGFDLRLVPEKLTEPFSWRSPKLVFVNSMSDLFQSGVPDDYDRGCVPSVMSGSELAHVSGTDQAVRESCCSYLFGGRLRFCSGSERTFGGESVLKIGSTDCPGSITFGRLPREFASCRLSRCWKTLVEIESVWYHAG